MAADCSKDRFLGIGRMPVSGTAMNSAWLPSLLKPRLPPEPKTDLPMSAFGPCTTTPAKSRPGVRGKVVSCILPRTFLMSLGLTAAALI